MKKMIGFIMWKDHVAGVLNEENDWVHNVDGNALCN